jgi:hypothetical protein
MSFNPVAFYDLASELYTSAVGDDAKLRSAISRAYYAALISARDAANIQPRGHDTHKQVIEHYQLADSTVATWLLDLKRHRTKADYEPSAGIARKDGGAALKTAKKVLLVLGKLSDPVDGTPPGRLH